MVELVLEAYEEYTRTQESLGKALGKACLIRAKLEHGNMNIRKDEYNMENTLFQVDALETDEGISITKKRDKKNTVDIKSEIKRRTVVHRNEQVDDCLVKEDAGDNKSRYAGRDQLISIYRDLFTKVLTIAMEASNRKLDVSRKLAEIKR